MNSITINGKTIVSSGKNISIINGKVKVDGKTIFEEHNQDIYVEVQGDCGNIDTTGNVTINGNCKNIDCTGNIFCYGDINGDIDSTGNVSLKRR